jgi:hypothetical protein
MGVNAQNFMLISDLKEYFSTSKKVIMKNCYKINCLK